MPFFFQSTPSHVVCYEIYKIFLNMLKLHLEPSRRSEMEFLTVNGLVVIIIITKSLILDVPLIFEYVSAAAFYKSSAEAYLGPI